MRLAKPLSWFAATALALLAGSHAIHAQSSKCTLEGGALSFGAYNPGFTANLDVLGSLTLTCNGNFQVQLSMSVGNGNGASYAGGRRMTSGTGGTLVYNLYTDPSRTLVLGDGTNGSARLNISGHGNANQVLWGRVPAGQLSVLPGLYTDTLIATVSY